MPGGAGIAGDTGGAYQAEEESGEGEDGAEEAEAVGAAGGVVGVSVDGGLVVGEDGVEQGEDLLAALGLQDLGGVLLGLDDDAGGRLDPEGLGVGVDDVGLDAGRVRVAGQGPGDLLVADVEPVDALLEPVDVEAVELLGAGEGRRQGPLGRAVPELVGDLLGVERELESQALVAWVLAAALDRLGGHPVERDPLLGRGDHALVGGVDGAVEGVPDGDLVGAGLDVAPDHPEVLELGAGDLPQLVRAAVEVGAGAGRHRRRVLVERRLLEPGVGVHPLEQPEEQQEQPREDEDVAESASHRSLPTSR